nr:hypothetical protein Iba_chr10aCG5950 [Ipomoea batatas]
MTFGSQGNSNSETFKSWDPETSGACSSRKDFISSPECKSEPEREEMQNNLKLPSLSKVESDRRGDSKLLKLGKEENCKAQEDIFSEANERIEIYEDRGIE